MQPQLTPLLKLGVHLCSPTAFPGPQTCSPAHGSMLASYVCPFLFFLDMSNHKHIMCNAIHRSTDSLSLEALHVCEFYH